VCSKLLIPFPAAEIREGYELPTGILADAYLPKGGFTFDQLRTIVRELVSAPPRLLR
jgi:hypothetical protein